ncbi:isochorismatase family protein [Casimicrobium huifangae]|uniref:isochorismatase family protein n=1 Tax=Casimicrobium huifangae TaxID=2591109 RepID=UPI0012EC176A|nr:isochorismatase family protein [Casimicrobium huifangae]
MATVRSVEKLVLMVVDVQAGVMQECENAAQTIANVARTVERARAAQVPVIWVQHESDELKRDSDAWQWVPALVPAAGEARVYKQFNSSFEQTNTDELLAQAGVSHIVLAGAQSNWCIRATAYGALERGYDLTLVKDAHTTSDLDLGNGTRIDAATIVRDLNVTMKWLQYPGRRNAVAAAEEVVFGGTGGNS